MFAQSRGFDLPHGSPHPHRRNEALFEAKPSPRGKAFWYFWNDVAKVDVANALNFLKIEKGLSVIHCSVRALSRSPTPHATSGQVRFRKVKVRCSLGSAFFFRPFYFCPRSEEKRSFPFIAHCLCCKTHKNTPKLPALLLLRLSFSKNQLRFAHLKNGRVVGLIDLARPTIDSKSPWDTNKN